MEDAGVEFLKEADVGEGNRNLLRRLAARLRNIAETLHKELTWN